MKARARCTQACEFLAERWSRWRQFQAGEPWLLFELPTPVVTYDVMPDGQRFLANLPRGREVPPSITLVSNWTAELGR